MAGTVELKIRRWKRVEYERLVECGVFTPGEHLELIDGLLVVREPQSSEHLVAVHLGQAALQRAFGGGFWVRLAGPVALDDDSEPEPDLAVVPGRPEDYVHAHPSSPVLAVEVALSSLGYDRGHKASLYARAGLQDYWIVNLVDRVVEVRRQPVPSDRAIYGWAYETLSIFRPGDFITPLAAPGAAVAVADLLPPS